jgi:hypothetical protein
MIAEGGEDISGRRLIKRQAMQACFFVGSEEQHRCRLKR